jgi:hypothetical protein
MHTELYSENVTVTAQLGRTSVSMGKLYKSKI